MCSFLPASGRFMEPEHLELLSFFPVFLHLLRCVVWGAAGVCKCLFKDQICRLVDHPTLYLPVLFCCVSFDEFSTREHEGGPSESQRWLTSSCLILIVSHVWISVSFSFIFPRYVFDHFATLDLSESLSISEAYFLNCRTPSTVKHTIILRATRKKRLPIKLWPIIDCKTNSSFRDVQMWKLGMS